MGIETEKWSQGLLTHLKKLGLAHKHDNDTDMLCVPANGILRSTELHNPPVCPALHPYVPLADVKVKLYIAVLYSSILFY